MNMPQIGEGVQGLKGKIFLTRIQAMGMPIFPE
jgi:hypothetical protein